MQKECNYKEVDLKSYQELVRKLICFLCGTRPNIAFEIEQLSKRNLDPKINHLKAVKQVACYLKIIMHVELKYIAFLKQINKPKHQMPPNYIALLGI